MNQRIEAIRHSAAVLRTKCGCQDCEDFAASLVAVTQHILEAGDAVTGENGDGAPTA